MGAPRKHPSRLAPGGSTARGYGYEHRRRRQIALAEFVPGTICWRCEKPMTKAEADAGMLDLDHDDADRRRYRGLTHRACNRGKVRPGQQGKAEAFPRCGFCHFPPGAMTSQAWSDCAFERALHGLPPIPGRCGVPAEAGDAAPEVEPRRGYYSP